MFATRRGWTRSRGSLSGQSEGAFNRVSGTRSCGGNSHQALCAGQGECYNFFMNERVKRISDQAKALSPEELEELVEDLMSSLPETDPEVEKAWAEEAERRAAAYLRGEMKTCDADEVFSDVRARLAQDRTRVGN